MMTPSALGEALRLAIGHHQSGRLAEAERIYRQILVAQPNHPDALHLLGTIAIQVGRLDVAVDLIGRAIAVNPNDPTYHHNLGQVFAALQKPAEAIDAYRRAISLKPDLAETHNLLGIVLFKQGDLTEAAASFQQAISLQPDQADSHNNLGTVFLDQNRLDDALREYHVAATLQPGNATMQLNLGSTLFKSGRSDEAVTVLKRALELDPQSVPTIGTLGNALHATGENQKAEELLRRAVELEPANAGAINNLATFLMDQGQIDEAIAQVRRALELDPENAQVRANLGLMLLLTEQFEQGWRESEWRVRVKSLRLPLEDDPRPRWDGRPLDGRRILIYGEQGFGDIIQFCRYLPLLKNQRGAGEVIFQCPPELARLLGSLSHVQILDIKQPLPEFDMRCPLMSLPMHFGTTMDSIPDAGTIPYLRADASLSENWKRRMVDDGKLKVGICWAGRADYRNDRLRSIPFGLFKPLLELGDANVRFYSLQKGSQAKELTDYTNEFVDFADTAALIDNLDLIISVDTAVAHLAGAMGKQVWLLLPFVPDWRWMMDRLDSSWYPTMRLFRQGSREDWSFIISQVARNLMELSS